MRHNFRRSKPYSLCRDGALPERLFVGLRVRAGSWWARECATSTGGSLRLQSRCDNRRHATRQSVWECGSLLPLFAAWACPGVLPAHATCVAVRGADRNLTACRETARCQGGSSRVCVYALALGGRANARRLPVEAWAFRPAKKLARSTGFSPGLIRVWGGEPRGESQACALPGLSGATRIDEGVRRGLPFGHGNETSRGDNV